MHVLGPNYSLNIFFKTFIYKFVKMYKTNLKKLWVDVPIPGGRSSLFRTGQIHTITHTQPLVEMDWSNRFSKWRAPQKRTRKNKQVRQV